jgi:NADH-quinone oxidoreductase subunit L
MSETLRPILWLIPVLPLLAAVLTAFLGPRLLRKQAHWPCVLAVIASCVLSLVVFKEVYYAKAPEEEKEAAKEDERTGWDKTKDTFSKRNWPWWESEVSLQGTGEPKSRFVVGLDGVAEEAETRFTVGADGAARELEDDEPDAPAKKAEPEEEDEENTKDPYSKISDPWRESEDALDGPSKPKSLFKVGPDGAAEEMETRFAVEPGGVARELEEDEPDPPEKVVEDEREGWQKTKDTFSTTSWPWRSSEEALSGPSRPKSQFKVGPDGVAEEVETRFAVDADGVAREAEAEEVAAEKEKPKEDERDGWEKTKDKFSKRNWPWWESEVTLHEAGKAKSRFTVSPDGVAEEVETRFTVGADGAARELEDDEPDVAKKDEPEEDEENTKDPYSKISDPWRESEDALDGRSRPKSLFKVGPDGAAEEMETRFAVEPDGVARELEEDEPDPPEKKADEEEDEKTGWEKTKDKFSKGNNWPWWESEVNLHDAGTPRSQFKVGPDGAAEEVETRFAVDADGVAREAEAEEVAAPEKEKPKEDERSGWDKTKDKFSAREGPNWPWFESEVNLHNAGKVRSQFKVGPDGVAEEVETRFTVGPDGVAREADEEEEPEPEESPPEEKPAAHEPENPLVARVRYFDWIVAGMQVKKGPDGKGKRALSLRSRFPVDDKGAATEEEQPGVNVGFTLRADALSAMMLVMITFIASFIAIYSIGYMGHDPGYPRFFAEIALFVFAMTLLVTADNFVLLYAGWEGVGLCSYLLIGFWFNKPSAAAAARKAFLVTRIGDVGLFLGILLLWYGLGPETGYSFDYAPIFEAASRTGQPGGPNHTLVVGGCLLLFCGAAGKSAQFPLHVWLPDAMEGPTPVSALIHAATMVTAGVYLVARCTPLFSAAPEAQGVVALIGGFTALLAALIALTQNDLKRVLAYSTLSQLGYMFLALGCAVMVGKEAGLVTVAVVAAMFHLFTHAFFKALLFLASGSVMHAMGNVIDIRRFGGLRKVMPITHWTFLCGALALAGFPLLAGFWSKDEVLDATWQAARAGGRHGWIYGVLFVSALLTAALTAFYTFRAYFKTFHGPLVVPPEADSQAHGNGGHEGHEEHAAHAPALGHGEGHEEHVQGYGGVRAGHGAAPALAAPGLPGPAGAPAVRSSYESPPVMTIPLVVLAVFAVGVGFVVGPLMPKSIQFAAFLEKAPGLPHAAHGHLNWWLMAVSTLLALGGIGLAYLMYVARPELPGKLAEGAQALYQLSLNKFHVDELYEAFILKPLHGLTVFLRVFDQHVVDGVIDLIGYLPRVLGALFRPVQNGLVQFYALAMVLGLTVFLLSLLRSL